MPHACLSFQSELSKTYGLPHEHSVSTVGVAMTTTYDPQHQNYFDEYDVRLEMARVFDVCFECRQCLSYCPTFPALISAVASKPDTDAGRLTPDEQDAIAQTCFRCTHCSSSCPYTPEHHQLAIDFPKLIDRHRAMQKKNRKWVLSSTFGHFLIGRSSRTTRHLLHAIVGKRSGGIFRRSAARVLGISSRFVVKKDQITIHVADPLDDENAQVVVFPTCVVTAPRISQALVDVYEHNGIDCSLIRSDNCCGANALQHGEMKSFVRLAHRTVSVLADAVRSGKKIVVPNPHCYSVMKNDYPHYVNTEDAALVASNVYESSEFLVTQLQPSVMSSHIDGRSGIVTSIAHHVSPEMVAQGIAGFARQLLLLTGAEVTDVVLPSGMEGMWGMHRENDVAAGVFASELCDELSTIGADVVVSNDPLAAVAIGGCGGFTVLHLMEVLAEQYTGNKDEEVGP